MYFHVNMYAHLKRNAHYHLSVQQCVSTLTLFCSSVYIKISKKWGKVLDYFKCSIRAHLPGLHELFTDVLCDLTCMFA